MIWDYPSQIHDNTYLCGFHTYSYDLLGHVTSLNGPWIDDTLSWQYLDAEEKVIRTSPGGVTEVHIGDTQHRMKSITNPLGLFTFGYDGVYL